MLEHGFFTLNYGWDGKTVKRLSVYSRLPTVSTFDLVVIHVKNTAFIIFRNTTPSLTKLTKTKYSFRICEASGNKPIHFITVLQDI